MSLNSLLHTYVQRGLNVSVRVLGIGSRFVLMFGLARLLAPSDLGLFGLIAGTIYFNTLLVGGDYYTFSHRQLLAAPRDKWSFVVIHHLLAIALLYAILLPAQLFWFWFGLLPMKWLWWYLVLLVVEHLAQELTRLLVVLGRPVYANCVLLIRSGAWVWVALPGMWAFPQLQRLEFVFAAWLVGATAAVLFGSLIVRREVQTWAWPGIDWKWLRRGFRVGASFLFATLCFRALVTADRYAMAEIAGPDLLGPYVLYVGIAMTLVTLLDSAVFSFLYPSLVTAHQSGDKRAYRQAFREMTWSAIIVVAGLAVLIALVAPVVLDWIGKEIYVRYHVMLTVLVAAGTVYSLGMIPHYGLYARHMDRKIIVSHITALPVFAVVVGVLAIWVPVLAVSLGLLTAFTWIAGFKLLAYVRAGG